MFITLHSKKESETRSKIYEENFFYYVIQFLIKLLQQCMRCWSIPLFFYKFILLLPLLSPFHVLIYYFFYWNALCLWQWIDDVRRRNWTEKKYSSISFCSVLWPQNKRNNPLMKHIPLLEYFISFFFTFLFLFLLHQIRYSVQSLRKIKK